MYGKFTNNIKCLQLLTILVVFTLHLLIVLSIMRVVTQYIDRKGLLMPAARARTTHMILLVDSDAENRDFLKSEFEARNHIVLEADDEVQALEILSHEKVDAVLIDLELTKKQRKEFMLKLQSEEFGMPHVILLASSSSLTREEGYDMGAEAVLSKPVEPEALVARVAKIIEPRTSRWRSKSNQKAEHKISLSLENLAMGRGGFTIISDKDREALEGQSIEFALEVTRKKWTIAGTGTVRYVKLDATKKRQEAWGIEIDSLEETSIDAIMQEFGSTLPLSYIPKNHN